MTSVRMSVPGQRAVTTTLEDLQQHLDHDGILLVDVVDDPDDPPRGPGELARLLRLPPDRFRWLGTTQQRPRVDIDGDHAGLMVPVVDDDTVLWAQAIATDDLVVLYHRGGDRLFAAVHRDAETQPPDTTSVALFRVLEDFLGSFRDAVVPVLLRISEVEDEILERRSRDQVLQLAALRRRLSRMQRAYTPYANLIGAQAARLASQPALARADARLARVYAGEVMGVAQGLGSAQDAVDHAMDTYATLLATEQNAVVNRLTIVSTVFLPLTFLTGFFGMNFGHLTEHIASPASFWLLGIGLPVLAAVGALVLLRRHGLLQGLESD